MTFSQVAGATGAALAAGIMNGVAGGGTLLSFPALILCGLSPVAANATSTVAIWPGQLSSVWAYRRHLSEERRLAGRLALPALLGGGIGSGLLLLLPEQSFEAVVPWLILFACAVLALQEVIKGWARHHALGEHPAFHWGLQLAISIYGGYFGAGIGILMLAAMGVLTRASMQHANALKLLLALLTNGVACFIFAFSGKVDLKLAGVMAVAAWVGGWLGALLAQRMSPGWMRLAAICIGLTAAGKFLLR